MINLKNQENSSLNTIFNQLKNKKVTLYNITQIKKEIDQFYKNYFNFDLYSFLLDKVYNDYTLLFGQPLNLN